MMNIKLHTPKSLKTGSWMASMKQFLLSIVATSLSNALTFGTAAIIDNKKKQSEKREIVMMVMFVDCAFAANATSDKQTVHER